MNDQDHHARHTIGCVQFLNAKPLVDGLECIEGLAVRSDVPSRLLDDLVSDRVDIALCPVIDYQLTETPLEIVPVGCIGCHGPTHTVRLFSQEPLERIRVIHADTDSHTSVALMRIVLAETLGSQPKVEPLDVGQSTSPLPPAMLLIGDKVVHARPPHHEYPYQLDLGQAWKALTGLPFVFAVWMTRQGTDLGNLPQHLDQLRRANRRRIDEIALRCAPQHQWPIDLAHHYLADLMQYDVGPVQYQAMEAFWRRAHEHGLFDHLRPLSVNAAIAGDLDAVR